MNPVLVVGMKNKTVGRMKAAPVPSDLCYCKRKRLQVFLRVHSFELSTRCSIDCLAYLKVISVRQIQDIKCFEFLFFP